MGTTETTVKTRTKLSTTMADLGGIVRLDFDYFNTFSFCFVLDETLQLIEAPVANPIVHPFSSSLFSYSFEVFHHNLVSVEVGNNVFADVMVMPSHEPFFTTTKLLEKPFGTSCAFSLEFATQVSELSFDLFDFGRIIKPVVGSDCEVVYSEVNAKNLMRIRAFDINLFGECEQEESFAFFVSSQEAFINLPTKIFFVTVWDVEFELLPFMKQSQRENVSFEISTSWEIIPDRSMIDNWFSFSFFDYSTALFDTSDSELGRQCLSQSFVNKRVEFNIIPDSLLPSGVNAELHSFNVSLDSSDYFFGCVDFDFGSCSDSHNFYNIQEFINLTEGISHPNLESMGIRNARFI